MNLTHHEPRKTGRSMRVADYIVAVLAAEGVEHVFGVGGANIEDLYDALHRSPDVEGVVAKHEFSATTMADGYARTANRTGVVAATSGGGALNVIAGLGEAFASRVPLLALIGQPPTSLEGAGAFQDTSGLAGSIDASRLFGEVSLYCARVESPLDLDRRLAEALAAARRGGPAVLLLPKDIQQAIGEFPEPHRTDPAAPHAASTDVARLAEAPARRLRPYHRHRRRRGRAGGRARGTRRTRARARGPDRRHARREGRARPGGPGTPRDHRRNGEPGCDRRTAGLRSLPARRHPTAGDGTGRPRRRAGEDARVQRRVGDAVCAGAARADPGSAGDAAPARHGDRTAGVTGTPRARRSDSDRRTSPRHVGHALHGRGDGARRGDARRRRRVRGRREHGRRCGAPPSGLDRRPVRRGAGNGRDGLHVRRRDRVRVLAGSPHVRDRRRRRVLRARTRNPHGRRIRRTGHVRRVQQQRPRDVPHARTGVLRGRLHLQPVSSRPHRGRSRRTAPRAAMPHGRHDRRPGPRPAVHGGVDGPRRHRSRLRRRRTTAVPAVPARTRRRPENRNPRRSTPMTAHEIAPLPDLPADLPGLVRI
ncbi:putative acetolactate synthase large subunit [Rhodococcus opacus B4]|uniref:acetolactate synthase n=1 Tax=Rhodococcus opacus (strain B4) TaxID=632772 RepID=C1AUL8_RHOOB|nr:putative acetolactate synthase large subunit [Rhodococcus opacus B4]